MNCQMPYHHAHHRQTAVTAGVRDRSMAQQSNRSVKASVIYAHPRRTCGNGLLRLFASLFWHP